jgi:hypothetical protein
MYIIIFICNESEFRFLRLLACNMHNGLSCTQTLLFVPYIFTENQDYFAQFDLFCFIAVESHKSTIKLD